MKYGVRDLRVMLLKNCQFYENRCSENHGLINSINQKFCPTFYIFRPIWKQNRYNKKRLSNCKRRENRRRKNNFPLEHKWISICTFHTYSPIWAQFGIRDLHAMLSSICNSPANWPNKGRNFLWAVSEKYIYACTVQPREILKTHKFYDNTSLNSSWTAWLWR
jgi:hypothetical protein